MANETSVLESSEDLRVYQKQAPSEIFFAYSIDFFRTPLGECL